MHQVALLDVLPSAQMGPPQGASLQGVSEAALDPFGAQLQGLFGDRGAQSRPIAVDRAPSLEITVPAQHILRFRLRDPAPPRAIFEVCRATP